MLPGEAENGVAGLPGEESVKRFEPSNGLDTALYKNHTFTSLFKIKFNKADVIFFFFHFWDISICFLSYNVSCILK